MCRLWWSRRGESDPEGQAEKFHVKQGAGTFQVWPGKSTCEFLSQLDHLPPLAGCRGGALPVLPGSWRCPPGSLVQLITTPPRMDPKDGQCSLANQSAHHTFLQLPSVRLSLQFSSAQLVSWRGPSSPLSRPVQTISLGRKEVGVQVAFSLLLVPSRARASRASSPQNSACPASPISPTIGPAHHTLCSLPFQQFY